MIDPTRDDRQQAWQTLSGPWFLLVFPAIAAHATRIAQGDRGVLELTIDTATMADVWTQPAVATQLESRWCGVDDFLALMRASRSFEPAMIDRWARMLEVMDPTRDVAVFLHSTPAADTSWCARFLVVVDARAPIH